MTDNEIQDCLRFVRKISGFTKPSKVNEAATLVAVDKEAMGQISSRKISANELCWFIGLKVGQ